MDPHVAAFIRLLAQRKILVDKECFEMTRRLVREEGIFAGASCGAAIAGALKYLKKHDREDMVAVIILPDSAKNYLSKVFNDNWMEENGFFEPDLHVGTVEDILKKKGKSKLLTLDQGTSMKDSVAFMKKHAISQVPVTVDGQLMGILSETTLRKMVQSGKRTSDISLLTDLDFCIVHRDTEIAVLKDLFDRYKVALVFDDKNELSNIITQIDLLDFMAQ